MGIVAFLEQKAGCCGGENTGMLRGCGLRGALHEDRNHTLSS